MTIALLFCILKKPRLFRWLDWMTAHPPSTQLSFDLGRFLIAVIAVTPTGKTSFLSFLINVSVPITELNFEVWPPMLLAENETHATILLKKRSKESA